MPTAATSRPGLRGLLDADHLVGLAIFVIALAVYFVTANTTVAFWDAGEFITTSYKLGIPHQPGYPLYVLVGRVISMLRPGITVAHAVNLMSGFFGALAIVFTYLTGVRLQRAWRRERENPGPAWAIRIGAAVGAGFLAFSRTFWENSTEAEVYSLAAFAMALAGYLAVLWYERRQAASSATLMLLAVYIMGLSIGFHMGSLLVFPGILLLVTIARDRELPAKDLWIVFGAMTAFVLSTMGASPAMRALTVVIGLGTLVLAVARRLRGRGFALAGVALFALGLSTYLYLLIRAKQDPALCLSDARTFDSLLHVLQRDQYPPRPMFPRTVPLTWQLGHFWGSAHWLGGQHQGERTIGYLQQFTFLPRPGFLDVTLPLLLWMYGLWCQWRGERRLFLGFFAILLTNTLGLLLFLNFTGSEVRDRDYFYSGGYQFLALFLGLGAGALLRDLWQWGRQRSWARGAGWAAAVLLTAAAFAPVLGASFHHPKWFEHDRRGDVTARNYGYNMLVALPQDAILFTGGDNDTFPLWYLQDVEGIRRDVRVVNLSLINLAWYLRQMKDLPPKVPITWSEDQIEGKAQITHRDARHGEFRTRVVGQRLPDGTVLWVRDLAMWHIVQANNAGPKRALYFAVTTDEEFMKDFLPYLVMEGMVYRLVTDAPPSRDGRPRVDPRAVWTNMTERYDLSGVVDKDGNPDTRIYRDGNTAYLLRNYPAALCQAAYFDVLDTNYAQARLELEMASRMEPTFPAVTQLLPLVYMQLGEFTRAVELAQFYVGALRDPWATVLDVGRGLLAVGQYDQALRFAGVVAQQKPNEAGTTQLLFDVYRGRGEYQQAEKVLADWVARTHDPRAAAELDTFRQDVREGRIRGQGR